MKKSPNDLEAGGGQQDREALLGEPQKSSSGKDGGGGEPPQKEEEKRSAAVAAHKAFNRLASFVALVTLGSITQLSFRLSQREGKYEYNTASAMCVVEFTKMCISFIQVYRESAKKAKHSGGGSVAGVGKNSAGAIFSSSLRQLPVRMCAEYLLLGMSYAVYNQLVFAMMHRSDPGTVSLFKSFAPAMVALINWKVTGLRTTELQWYCLLIQIFGIIPVIMKCEGSIAVDPLTIAFIMAVISMGAFNSVYNAKLIKTPEWEQCTVSVQNIVLYAYGTVLALLGYFFFSSGGGKSFFYGYDHWGVRLLLFFNAFVGVAISFVYRHGDAVLKTFAQPLVASIVVYASSLLTKSSLDVVQAAGAGTVVLASLVYLRLPASKDAPSGAGKKDDGARARSSNFPHVIIAILLCIACGAAYIVAHLSIYTGEAESSTSFAMGSNITAEVASGEAPPA
uniref:EamA domain-containing protein n=1 Tax=Odontella aurita TaxID=265563 RepID=A0A7S4MYU8_9STRA|mmetsp:Transcript_40397/g.121716  ORF Transcript_40397/g.121716 Transcript_40397/m.121716 type:complete len:451 (+) Transcript_40397:68-1420(+)